jgi:hypothetical protein
MLLLTSLIQIDYVAWKTAFGRTKQPLISTLAELD